MTPRPSLLSSVDTSGLNTTTLCIWRLGVKPSPLVTTRPVRLRIDDRCNAPLHANPAVDAATTVYSAASRNSPEVGQISDGYLITIRCYEPNGAVTNDAVGNTSSIWLGIEMPRGLIPDVNIGGGYTESQLASFGLGPC